MLDEMLRGDSPLVGRVLHHSNMMADDGLKR